MFFDFQGQKVMLKAEFEATLGLLAQAGSIFWIQMLAASSLRTCGSDTGSEWQIITLLVNICPFYGSPWKYFIFSCAFAWLPQNFLSSIEKISFPHIYWPMPGMPFCSWLSRAWDKACHPTKTRRIRHIAFGFSSIYGQIRLPRIIEHMKKGMFVPTRVANVYKQYNLSNFLQKEVPMGT